MLKTCCCSLIAVVLPVALRSSRGEQLVELPGAVEGGQLVEAAHVPVPDVDLGHRAASRFLHHFRAALGLQVDADLVDGGYTLRAQQPLGHLAERADARAVHRDLGHARGQPLSSGRLACCHAAMPPRSANASGKPCLRSVAATPGARDPVPQLTMIGRERNFSSSLMRSASCASWICLALAMCPAAYSPEARTSSTSASRRLMSCTASNTPTSWDARNGRDTSGHSSIPPEASASPSSTMLNGLFCRKTRNCSN